MLKQLLKPSSDFCTKNHFINVYPQTKTYADVDTDEHVTGALIFYAQTVDTGMVMISDCGDTQRHLEKILPKNVRLNPTAFMAKLKNVHPSLYHQMKSVYRINLGPNGFFVIVTPSEMRADKHGYTQSSQRVVDLAHFIVELYFIDDYKTSTK